jgi:hypothetical protein
MKFTIDPLVRRGRKKLEKREYPLNILKIMFDKRAKFTYSYPRIE